jgi:hypothetical protein
MTNKLQLAIGAVALLAAGAPAHANSLSGLWKTTITLIDCSSGNPLAPDFTSLLSFSDNGTESEDTNNPALQPGQRSTGYGVWRSTGDNTFHMDSYALILFGTDGPPPIEAGSQQIHQDIVFSRKNWTSKATVEFYDTAGTLYRSGCAKAASARLK